MFKLSESLHYYESFLKQETLSGRTFYNGRWIIMIVIIRFIH